MDIYILDLLVIGIILLAVTLSSRWIARLPFSYALLYLIIGLVLGPYGFNLIRLRPGAEFLEHFTELVVIISLYSCGLKMNRPLTRWGWDSTIRLIGFLMPISIFAIALLGHYILDLGWGAAVLLGAILAPTDPVLASEVQINHLEDRDELRFGLTSEGGLNDALAFPFVYFGIHYLENDRWQDWFRNWVAMDLVWAIAVGILVGILVAKIVVWIDKRCRELDFVDSIMENFIALGIILSTYALAELVNGYGFLAVFVAGVVAQRSYKDPERSCAQLEFTEMIEKLMEIGTILLLGALLRLESVISFLPQALLVAGGLFFIIRPAGAWVSTVGGDWHPMRRLLFGWFGIRGVGSLYYLFYAMGEGLRDVEGETVAWITLITVVMSVVLHGITSTPIMNWYEKRRQISDS